MTRFRIETDATLRAALGMDGAEWASAYIKSQCQPDGDGRHQELAAWFNAAIEEGLAQAICVVVRS